MNFARLVTSAVLLMASLTAPSAEPVAPLIKPVSDPLVLDSPYWYVRTPADESKVFFLFDDHYAALMNIDGSDVLLNLTGKHGSAGKVGDVIALEFEADKIRVQARFKVSWLCPKSDDDCSVTSYDVTIKVTKGSRSESIDAVGSSGT